MAALARPGIASPRCHLRVPAPSAVRRFGRGGCAGPDRLSCSR